MHIRIPSIIITSAIFIVGCAPERDTSNEPLNLVRPAKIVPAESTSGSAIRIYPGTIEASRESALAFRVGGQIKLLPAQPGKRFKQGELLAALDETEFENTLKDRQAQYKLAKSRHEKITELRKENYASRDDVDQAEAALKVAEASLASAKDNITYTQLLAPYEGIIANLNVENFQTVSANQTVLNYRGDANLDVRFNVPENLLGQLRRVENPAALCAKITFNAYPSKSYNACFKEYESTPDSITRSYSVAYTMPQVTDFSVLPGMAVKVELDLSAALTNQSAAGALVPVEAVFQQGGKTWVWKVDDESKTSKTEVVVGEISHDKIIVLNGVTHGDNVIAAGVSFIQEGMQVKPLTKERGL